MPILECPEAIDDISSGDEIEVDFAKGKIKNLSTGNEFFSKPFPEFMQNLMTKGGLMQMVKTRI